MILLYAFTSYSQVSVFTEDFEHGSNMPTGWTQEYVYDTLNWVFTSGGQSGHPSGAHGGSYNGLLYYGGIYRTTKLVTKALNLSAYSNLQLKFWHTQEEYSGDQDILKVYYKTSATGSWVLLSSYTTSVASWTQQTITLPNPSSAYYIAFEGEARYGYGICVDDLSITGTVTNGLDISFEGITTPLIWGVGNNTLKIKYKNKRSDTIFNADFGYKLDNNSPVIDTNKSTGTMLANQEKDYTFTSPLSISKGSHYIKLWVNKPNRTNPDDNPGNDTFTLNFGTGIKDTFIIDKYGSGDYTTFSAAVADLNNGVTGPVWFFVKPATYTEKVIIGEIPGASSTNTITFDGFYKDSTFLSFTGTAANNRATLTFKGADYVTFKNMTIKNDGTTYGVAVLLKNQSDYNTFYNCDLKLKTTATNAYTQVILASSDESSYGADGDNCNYTLFENCLIEGGQYGARMHGTNTASMAVDNSFINCNFTNQYYYGLYLYYQQGFNISYSTIANFRNTSAYGLLNYYSAGSTINGNSIQPGIHAIYLYRENYYSQSFSTNITNNMICNFMNSVNQRGIYAATYCYNLNILHNSILVDGSSTSPTYTAIYLYYYCNNSVIQNNLLSSKNNAFLLSMLYAGSVSVDYNDYYYDTNSPIKFYINYSSATLSTFKSISSYINYPHDLNSYDNVDPGFVSNTNLHLDTLNSISLMAPPVGIASDFDNDSRDTSFGVNIGADEILHPNRDLDIISIDTPAVLIMGNNTVAITLRNMGTDSLLPQTIYLNYSLNGTGQVNDSLILSSKLPPFGSMKFSFKTPINVTGAGSFDLCIQISPGIYNDPDTLDKLCATKCLGIKDTFYIDANGHGDYTTITAAINSLQTCGISGAVTFILKAGTFVERVIIPEIPGASSVNTVTFHGIHKDSVLIVHAGSATERSNILLNGADHIIIENMKILNNGNSYGGCIHFMNGADSNTVENCILTVSTTTSSYIIPVVASNSELYYNTYGNTANGNLIKNNTITGGYFGISMVGTDKSILSENNRIIGNTLRDQYYMSIYQIYEGNTEIKGNNIKDLGLYYGYGIYNYYCTNSRIESNVIQPGRFGIYLYRENDVFPNNSTYVINNMISNFNDGTYQSGIFAYYYSNKVRIYHNSIYMDGSVNYAYYGGISLYYYSDSCIVKNNIIVSDGNDYLISSYLSTGSVIDYNDYYAPNNSSNKFFNSASYTTLSAYKLSNYYLTYPHNVNSFDNIDPGFISSSNCHLASSSAGLGGDTLGILVDIDGDFRCQASPTIGADESGPISNFSINNASQCMEGNNFVFSNTSQGGSATLSYFWSFGDGDTSTAQSPVHTYASSGTYMVTLIAYPSLGCNDTTSKIVNIFPSPQIGYTINDSTQCQEGNYFSFQNTSSIGSGTLTYNWNFGDGYSAGIQSPVHAFSYSDTFAVRLIVTSNLGCIDTLIKDAYVFPMPDADFSINSGTQCFRNNSFTFTNNSTISSGSMSYLWNFGDGNTSSQTSPDHSYLANGNYDVKLMVSSDFGCKDSITRNTSVVPTPTAAFVVSDTSQCLNGNQFIFTNNSTVSSGSLSYQWTFGDGDSSTQSNPNYSYSAAGTYQVKLKAITGDGCYDSSMQWIIVHPALIADFSINDDNQCLTGNSFIFTNSTTLSSGTMSYAWSFGDGITSADSSPVHVYNDIGLMTVTLVSSSTNGCSDTIGKSLNVGSMPLSVNDTSLQNRLADSLLANYPFIGNAQDVSGLSNNGTVYGSALTADQCGRTDSAYYFDGVNDYIRVPHAFLLNPFSSMSISVWIYPTQSGGTQYILYKYQNAVYKGYYLALINNKVAVTFGGQLNPVYSNSTIQLNQWNHIAVSFDGWHYKIFINNVEDASGIAANSYASITPLYIGTKGSTNFFKGKIDKIRLYAKSFDNIEIKALYDEIPYIKLSDSLLCSNTSTEVVLGNTQTGISYRLKDYVSGNFVGNAVMGTGCNIILPTGNLTSQIKLQIVAKDTASLCELIMDTILTIDIAPMPTAGFSLSPTSSCLSGNNFTFTNTSSVSSGTLNYLWTFGDSTTSSQAHPVHQYTYADSFEIKLVTSTEYGCQDSSVNSVVVHAQPSAGFTLSDSIQCFDRNAFAFNNTSGISSGTLYYYWNFGDGSTSSLQSPVHSYTYADTFLVELIVTSDKGCKDSVTKVTYLQVNPMPTASFSVNDSTQCLAGNYFVMTNSSSISSGSINYTWSFGDGNYSSAVNTTKQYATHDTFDIILLAVSDKGCKDSVIHKALLFPDPQASFTVSDTALCLNTNTFSFTNQTTIDEGSFASLWSFGDSNISTSLNPAYSYTYADTFTVKLITSSAMGCLDSFSRVIQVEPSLIAGFTVNDTAQCLLGNSFVFTDQSVAGAASVAYNWSFGDGSTSTLQSPSHSFANPGTYTVKQWTTYSTFCQDSFAVQVYVFPMPTADFSINDTSQCLNGNSVSLTNNSSISAGSMTYSWTFGDGNYSTSNSPQHTYSADGSYEIQLLSTSGEGCMDSLSKDVYIRPMPDAAYSINSSTQCLTGNNFEFTNSSTISSGSLTYQWTFGDGQSSTQISPSHAYTSAGTYNVKLLVQSGYTCMDSVIQQVTVYPMPSVSFSANQDSQCYSTNNFQFSNSSSIQSGSMNYNWTFGDGNSSTTQNPGHSYNSAGSYNVKLLITSDKNCKDSALKSVIVHPSPIAAFSINDSTQCLNLNQFSFTNGSTISGGSISYVWQFGEGSSSTSSNPTKTYTNEGSYQVKLMVTSNQSCTDSVDHQVIVYPIPQSGFSVNQDTQCFTGNQFVFSNNTTISSGSLTYNWDFDDNSTSAVTSPTHNFSSYGTYDIELIATSNNDCKDTSNQTVVVHSSPIPGFSINDSIQCLNGNSFVFTNNGTISNGTFTSLWTFGDGDSSSQSSTSHTYNSAGTYLVTLKLSSTFGCVEEVSHYVYVNPNPVVSFSVQDSTQCFAGNTFSYTNQTTISSGTVSYSWTFGDNSVSSQTSPVHSYNVAGTYSVSLIGTSDQSCMDSSFRSVIVYPMPSVSFNINDTDQCFSGNNFQLSNSSSISSGTLSYLWTFGDGADATSKDTNHTYNTPGQYSIRLQVNSSENCSDSSTKSVVIYPNPDAVFGVTNSTQCFDGNSFNFSDSSTITSGSLTYNWNFGDGSTSAVINPAHSFTSPNTYVVKLITNSDKGCSDSAFKTLNVNPSPIAGLSLNDSVQCFADQSFVFTDQSQITNGTYAILWHFGDGDTSTANTVAHAYNSAGTYQLKLIVTSNLSCQDSIFRTLVVYPSPIASFSVNDTTQCENENQFVFTNNSSITGSSMTYAWTFGDGQNSSTSSPAHAYNNADTFDITLVVSSAEGCNDSTLQYAYVYPSPQISFTLNDSSQCFNGHQFVFTNQSQISSGSLSYLWTFGDMDSSNTQSPTHSYISADTYLVTLIGESALGCLDTSSHLAYVLSSPTAAFTVNDSTQCERENQFVFTNNSSITGSSMTYAWSFGDGQNSSTSSPAHAYTNADTFDIKLVVSSAEGCNDSTSQYAYVYPSPQISFTLNDSSQCFSGHQFVFTNQSQISSGSLSYLWTFGDMDSSNTQSPTHSYITAGTYLVTLIGESALGCLDTSSHLAYVLSSPIAAFTVNDSTQCESGNNFIFTNNSSISTGNLSYNWDFGDMSNNSSQHPQHVYSASGLFDLSLVVSSSEGCEDSTSATMDVYPSPLVSFSVNNAIQCFGNNSFVFTNVSTQPAPMTWLWNFGDGDTSSALNNSHSYSQEDTFLVILTGVTDDLCSDSHSIQVITKPGPKADFSINQQKQCEAQNSFTFTNNSQFGNYTVHYFWELGDGDTSSMLNVTHSYSDSGMFYVQLIVAPDSGCVDTMVKVVEIRPEPLANFMINDAGQCLGGNNFIFTNSSDSHGYPLSNSWSFGDGNTSLSQSPTHTYSTAGTYEVKLIISNSDGCIDSVTKTVHVYLDPSSSFAVNTATQCLSSNTFILTDNSTSPVNSTYKWYFGDAATSTVKGNVNHSYTKDGIYTISLVITTPDGCMDSVSSQIAVNPNPIVSFVVNDDTQCLKGNQIKTTNISTISSGSMTHFWAYGDGRTSNLKQPAFSYTAKGTYTLKLVSTSVAGCNDSMTKVIEIYESPLAGFSIATNNQCLENNSFDYQNSSTIGSGSLSYLWDFGGGNTSTATNANHVYTSSGSFPVILYVTASNGCRDSIIKQSVVYPMPKAGFNINKDLQCIMGNLFEFTNTSTISSGTVNYKWYFGDGDSSVASMPSHSYNAINTYQVKLLVNSDHQCTDTISKSVRVKEGPQVYIGKDIFTHPNVSFNVDAGPGFMSYLWQDGNKGRVYTVYTNDFGLGDHLIHVKVTDSAGCQNADSMWIHVWKVDIEEVSSHFSYTVYPNPARGHFSIDFKDLYDTRVIVIVEDIQGREVFSSEFNPLQNKGIVNVDLNEAKGVYLVKMIIGNKVEVHKVMMY
ncbi:pectinesterase family protein [Bacteroidota bacterium]